MNSVISKQLLKMFNDRYFPNDKNRLWTMCQIVLKMLIRIVEEAERLNMTNEQFYLNFEDTINLLSIKDHVNNEEQTNEFYKVIKEFYDANPE